LLLLSPLFFHIAGYVFLFINTYWRRIG
jgi:hypothetical protein